MGTVGRKFTCGICGSPDHTRRNHYKVTDDVPPKAVILRPKKVFTPTAPTLIQVKGKSENGFASQVAFVEALWKELNHTPPSRLQCEISEYMEFGPEKQVILAPRGVGKSTLTAALALRTLKRDRNEKIVCVSKSQRFAVKWTGTLLRIIHRVEWLQDLKPQKDMKHRESVVSFDVDGADPSLHESVAAFGIEAQLPGCRGSLVIPDDVETPGNTRTVAAREGLEEQTREFRNLIIPNRKHKIIYIGTVHHEESLYYKLVDRGFEIRKWPICYPSRELFPTVSLYMAPSLLKDMEQKPELMANGVDSRVGMGVDRERFNDKEIDERIKNGWSNFLMQSMLTPIGDKEDKPLKLQDMIVMDTIDKKLGPMKVSWTANPMRVVQNIEHVGLDSDRWHYPESVSPEMAPWEGTVITMDPSSTGGADDFAWNITRCLNSQVFLVKHGVLASLEKHHLVELAETAVKYGATTIWDEINYGGGMFRKVFQPILQEVCFDNSHRCGFHPEGYKRKGDRAKERFIVDVLSNFLSSHLLVVQRSVIEEDLKYCRKGCHTGRRSEYRLFNQLVNIMPDVKDCLAHDDQVDALAMACYYWKDQMSKNRDREIQRMKAKQITAIDRMFLDQNNVRVLGSNLPAKPKKKNWNSWVLNRT